jgi:hypothetical protein
MLYSKSILSIPHCISFKEISVFQKCVKIEQTQKTLLTCMSIFSFVVVKIEKIVIRCETSEYLDKDENSTKL